MGTPGVPFPYTEDDIKESIIKHNGVMRKVAEELNCSHDCIYRHFNKYPSLKSILEQYRYGRKERVLDSSEDVLLYAVEECKEKDLTNSLKAAFFFLNNRGKDRGYTPLPEVSNQAKEEAKQALKDLAAHLIASRGSVVSTTHTTDQLSSATDASES